MKWLIQGKLCASRTQTHQKFHKYTLGRRCVAWSSMSWIFFSSLQTKPSGLNHMTSHHFLIRHCTSRVVTFILEIPLYVRGLLWRSLGLHNHLAWLILSGRAEAVSDFSEGSRNRGASQIWICALFFTWTYAEVTHYLSPSPQNQHLESVYANFVVHTKDVPELKDPIIRGLFQRATWLETPE